MSAQTDALAAAAQALTEAMRATTSDPADAIRILTAFLLTNPPVPAQTGAAGAQAATTALFRRAALASIALACADYQPASSTEANTVIASVSSLLDTEEALAADTGDLNSYTALREMRHSIIEDLTARSASLPSLVTVQIRGNLPSLAMAYRLYGDTTREPDMVARADVIHPGFMPPSFEALSS